MQRGAFFFRRFAASLLFACSFSAFATTSVYLPTGVSTTGPKILSTLDSSCPAFKAAAESLYPGTIRILACSSDPVGVGTRIMSIYDPGTISSSPIYIFVTTVTAQTSPVSSVNYADADYPIFQQAMTSFANDLNGTQGTGSGGTSGTTSTTVTVASAFGTATPDQYAAMTTIFGLILCAGAIIWGGKRVLKLFGTMGEA